MYLLSGQVLWAFGSMRSGSVPIRWFSNWW